MTYAKQSRAKIVVQLMTINYDVVVPDEMIREVIWSGYSEMVNENHMNKVICDARKILPCGTIERVRKTGYVYRSKHEI